MNLINLREYKTINKYNKINDYGISAQKYYLTLYCFYIELIVKSIIEETNIKKYDEIISKLGIEIKDKKNVYNKITNDNLKYFFIANSFSLNEISDEDLMYLSNKIFDNNLEYDDECKRIIKDSINKSINRVKLQLKINIYGKDIENIKIKEIINKLSNEVKNIFNVEIKIKY